MRKNLFPVSKRNRGESDFASIFSVVITALLFLCPFLVFAFSSSSHYQKYSLSEAQRVFDAIEKILREQPREAYTTLKKIVISESELNSYIAYRIDVEKEEVMRELKLKLFERNTVEGKILIDLRGHSISRFLRPLMNLYFEGKLEVEKDKVRIKMKKLYLEDQSVQPMILDLIIYIASKIENTDPSSINDWHELPFGIKDIKTHRGQAVFYY